MRLELGALAPDRRDVRVDGRPVAARDRAGQLEAVLDRARASAARAPRAARPPPRAASRRRAAERDEVVRRDRGARVVERARRSSARSNGRRPSVSASQSPRARASSVSAVTAAHAPSSCSGPRARVSVCSGWTPKRRSCGSSAASGVAPLTCATHGPGSIDRRDLGDRAVGHAEQRRAPARPSSQRDAALAQARGDRRADAAGADDGDSLEHVVAPVPRWIPGTGSVPSERHVYAAVLRSVRCRSTSTSA